MAVPAVVAASTSPGSEPAAIVTVAEATVGLAVSVSASAGSTATGAPPAANVTTLPPFASASGAAGAVTTSSWVALSPPTAAVIVGVPGCESSM